MQNKVVRAKVIGYIEADPSDTSEFVDVLEKIREIGCAEIVNYEIIDVDTPFPEIQPEGV